MGFNLLNDTQRQAYIAETNGWDLQKRKQLQNTFVYVLVFNLPFKRSDSLFDVLNETRAVKSNQML